MILDISKIALPLAVVIPLIASVVGFAGAVLLDRSRIEQLQTSTAEHAKQLDSLKDRHEEEHVQIEVLKTDVRYIREGVDRIESHLPRGK